MDQNNYVMLRATVGRSKQLHNVRATTSGSKQFCNALCFIADLGSGGERVKLLATKSFVGSFSGVTTKVQIHTV